jgi:nucleotide-binding universal stress UspA family protein
MIAYDGSTAASRAVHMAALLGLTEGSQIQLLSIDSDSKTAQGRADGAAALLRNHGAEVSVFGVQSDADPAELILGHVRAFGADMVVMGAYEHGGLRDAIFGSCTRRLLAECPRRISSSTDAGERRACDT